MTIVRLDGEFETVARDPDAPTSMFFVLERFDVLYRKYAAKPGFDRPIYALPVHGTEPGAVSKRYVGLDRDPICAYAGGSLAQIRLAEIAKAKKRDSLTEDLLLSIEDANDVLEWAEREALGTYELAWARIAGTNDLPPAGFERRGCEPTYANGHFSAICDALAFPRWHGTDRGGTAFRSWFERLNDHALFDHASDAAAYLDFYVSFDWTERGVFEIVEVWTPRAL
ncbi:MAG TPA: hypothetical protein VF407_01955 [Polyangiaceae bacterium]